MAPPALLANLTSALWPISNLVAVAAGATEPKPESTYGKGKPYTLNPLDHLGIFAGVFPRFLLAWFLLGTLPSLETASTLALPWIVSIVLRDLAVTVCVAGLWDTIVYSKHSPIRSILHPVKFNPSYPKPSQLPHDVFWSLVSTLVSSAWEVAILHAWAHGIFSLATPPQWWTHPATVAWLLSMPYWRLSHFFFVHRAMHKWGTTSVPDIGAFLYKHVHRRVGTRRGFKVWAADPTSSPCSLHHKSRNPTSWSGISMHPVESGIYYTAMLIPVVCGAHPLVMLFCKADLTIAALIGHDGYGYPSTGSHDHWLHHHLVTINYGENYVPWDYWFGCYAGSEEDYVRRFGPSKSEHVFHPGDSEAELQKELTAETLRAAPLVGGTSASPSVGSSRRRNVN